MKHWVWALQDWKRRKWEKILMWIAWHLPRKIVMWSTYRVYAHATTGKWGCESPTDLLAMEAVKRWDIPNEDRPKDRPKQKTKGA